MLCPETVEAERREKKYELKQPSDITGGPNYLSRLRILHNYTSKGKVREIPNSVSCPKKKIISEFGNLVNIGNIQCWCRDITKMRDMHRRTICSVYGRERSKSESLYIMNCKLQAQEEALYMLGYTILVKYKL